MWYTPQHPVRCLSHFKWHVELGWHEKLGWDNLQELNSLQQQLRGLQEELQESSQEVARLEGAAVDLDGKAVQLQKELDQAHHEHQEALHQLQVSSCAFPLFVYALLWLCEMSQKVGHTYTTAALIMLKRWPHILVRTSMRQ